ncbi:CBS domain-containing protein [Paludibacterium purpuratum]|uniref:CBS domain protein n=1 Tax=Paludibacterium purpuratum TaxID=1144873 RepID=A0A4R7BGH7_9NEIS|nr:CBS domain-containing protein [Paludibacterium purpuratum]TDR82826.1 CBS domain protein [Paludibacterium purpuratum]
MFAEFRPLPIHSLPRTTDLVEPDQHPGAVVTLDSPALSVMTDLRQVRPVCIQQDATLREAHQLMVCSGIRLLFVEDHQHGLVGLVTAVDLLGERPIVRMREQGKPHAEVWVRDVMTPRIQLDALSMEEVAQARVGELVATMQQLGRQHTLVVQVNPGNGHHQLCGLFSTTHMARKLGMALSFIRLPQSLSELHHSLLHAQ